MIQAFSLFFLSIGMMAVIWLEMFNGLDHGSPVTAIGVSSSLLLAVMLYFVRIVDLEVHIKRVGLAENIVLLSCLGIFSYLGYVTMVYGYSPTLSFFIDGYVPPELLYGRYRDLMPMRNIFPPLVVAQTVFVFILLPWRRTLKSTLVHILTFVSLFGLSVVVDTRHVLLWPVLYLICAKLPRVNSMKGLLTKKNIFIALLIGGLVWLAFVILGNIRIGSAEAVEFGARQLAIDFELNSAYWDYPGVVIWAIIYLFSGFARGIDRESELEVFHFYLPEQTLPGFLQFIPKALGLHAADATDRFSQQAMAVDGYHMLCIYYGFLLGTALFIGQVFLFLYVIKKINQNIKSYSLVGAGWFILFLWLGVRILLLPIGAYAFDFSGWMEFLFLYFFMYVAKISMSGKKMKNEMAERENI